MPERMKAIRGKRGAALAELMVTLALLAIVSTMIVSFSAVTNTHVETEQTQYALIEETDQIKEKLSAWLSQMDERGTVVTVAADQLSVGGTDASAAFDDWEQCLFLKKRDGAENSLALKRVENVQFELKKLSEDNAIVFCTVIGSYGTFQTYSQTFVLTLRCGSFAE